MILRHPCILRGCGKVLRGDAIIPFEVARAAQQMNEVVCLLHARESVLKRRPIQHIARRLILCVAVDSRTQFIWFACQTSKPQRQLLEAIEKSPAHIAGCTRQQDERSFIVIAVDLPFRYCSECLD